MNVNWRGASVGNALIKLYLKILIGTRGSSRLGRRTTSARERRRNQKTYVTGEETVCRGREGKTGQQ